MSACVTWKSKGYRTELLGRSESGVIHSAKFIEYIKCVMCNNFITH